MVLTFSIILPVFKEKNVHSLVIKLIKQYIPKEFHMQKIFIVGLGFDKQNLNKIKKVILIEEKFRRGKAAAVSTALKNIKSDILILQSSYIKVSKNTLKNILLPFLDKKIGMVTCKPIPVDNPDNFAGFLVNLIWSLHHIISLHREMWMNISPFP